MKFRRNKADQVDGSEGPEDPEATGPDEAAGQVDVRGQGPWDISEVELDPDDQTKIDLGGLIVTGSPDVELRLQVDEESQQIAAVLLVGEEGAIELRPFAASRNSDIWNDIRKQIAAEAARLGGTASEADGAYGKELQILMNVTTPDGQSAQQPSRVLGITGPRWLLRATMLGNTALDPDPDGVLATALREVVVVRGDGAMAPGDPLPLVMPENAEPVDPPS